ncbi:D-alanine--D-alanine ligase [Pseudofulvibacter geojedonensis]|uniref:D-alanine--D-alanine ligase n=1 Tax=Pseudofulvibacter geojedonensis TaxID=1123758 RepID=A0ABW3I5R5_9FLAO
MSKNIAILMGGYSSEYQISINSGNVVYNAIKEHYNCYRALILKEKWVCLDEHENEFLIDKSDFSITINKTKITFDCAFNTIHGTPGEDGHIQGYLSLLGIPQTSCNLYQSALTFNKRDLLSVLKPYGIDMATSIYYNKGQEINTRKIIDTVGLPCFVKANRAGSSFGVTKVYKEEDIKAAIDISLNEDSEVLIESFLNGTEVSVGVITYKGKVTVLPITEIVSETDFFDYQAKYEGKSQEITPARITQKQAQEVSKIAKYIYETLNMSGFSRSDFIFHNGKPHFIEMNTTPGLSKESILPQQAKEAGISLVELFSNSIDEALK